jgi:ABC-type Mn2+/Zn2+ transport system permease subunit
MQAFFESWPLFRETYLAAWCIAALLGLVGVLVVARDQIFVGAAISQASTLGIALGMSLGAALAPEGSVWRSDHFLSVVAVVCAVVAALLIARSGAVGRESHEAVTGFVYLLGASTSVLVIASSPHGLDEVQKLVASSVIGADMHDVGLFGGLGLATAAFVCVRRRPLVLFAMDPLMARAVGVSRWWDSAAAAWLGLVMGVTIRSAGMLYAFGCLVLPALVAKNVCRATLPMFVVAPVVAVVAAVGGFVAGNVFNLNEAQLTVAVLCALLGLAWTGRALRGHH